MTSTVEENGETNVRCKFVCKSRCHFGCEIQLRRDQEGGVAAADSGKAEVGKCEHVVLWNRLLHTEFR
jgi:hypothetical protein